jgi:hypothetical protein
MRFMTAIETSIAERMRRSIRRNYHVYSLLPNNISYTKNFIVTVMHVKYVFLSVRDK